MTHIFLFKPSIWLGTGKIQLGTAKDKLPLHTRWTIAHNSIKQEVEILGVPEPILNTYSIKNVTESGFTIFLTSATVKNIEGKGTISDTSVSWTFNDEKLSGFENYEKQHDGVYLFQAEFGTFGEFCNQVEGKIWQSG